MAFDYFRNELKRHYEEDFNSKAYLDDYYKPGVEVPWWENYFLHKFHEVFQEDNIFAIKDDADKVTCLEVGSGPTIHRLASASRIFDTLTVSDISEDCLRFLKHYLWNLKAPSRRFQRFYETVAKLEGFKDLSEGALAIENRIRDKIVGVIRCDVLYEDKISCELEPVNSIISCGCLEKASITLNDFSQAVKNLVRYLKPGGYLILAGFFGGNYFLMEKDVVPCLQFDLGAVRDALIYAKLEVIQLEECAHLEVVGPVHNNTNCTGCFFSLSKKTV